MRRWLGILITSLLLASLVGSQQQAFYFRMPVISADGSDVLYQAIPIQGGGQPTLDVFQMFPGTMTTQGMQVILNGVPLVTPQITLLGAARPHFSVSQGLHVVYMSGGNGTPFRIYLYDRQKGLETLISKIGLTPAADHSLCPRINGNGRIIAFVSRDPNLHDPDGNGASDPLPPYATPSPAAPWIIYIHDRDVDGNGTYDEVPPDPSVVTVATFAVGVTSLPYIALSPDTGGTYIAYQVYNPAGKVWGLFVKDWRNNIVTDPPVAVSPVAFSVPSVVGIIQPVAGALVAFTANTAFNGNRAGVWIAQVDFTQALPAVLLTPISLNNGVNGSPILSPDASHLAFHSTATDVIPNPPDRNGVDDIFVFDLTTQTPVWSSLLVRGLAAPPPTIGPFDPCVHPSLSSIVGNSVFVAFEHWAKDATGQPQIIIRKVQIPVGGGSGTLLLSWRLPRARRYVPLPY